MKKLILAAAMGAGLMWFYDPANGAQRREALQRTINKGTSGASPQGTLSPEDGSPSDVAMFAAR